MDFTETIGYMAAALATLCQLPQLYRIISTKSAKDVSLLTYVTLLVAVILWFVYGLFTGSMPLIVANLLSAFILASVVWMKIKYGLK